MDLTILLRRLKEEFERRGLVEVRDPETGKITIVEAASIRLYPEAPANLQE